MIFPMLASLLLPIVFSVPASAVSFINPPPSSGLGRTADFDKNPVYHQGSAIEISWSDTADNGIPFSVVVLQVDYSKGTPDIPSGQAFEYVVHNGVNLTSTTWVASTAKNLTFSNVFVLDVFFQGDTTGRALSHWFNITSSASALSTVVDTQTITSASSSTTATSSTTSSTATATNPPAAPTSNDGGFTTAAKAGLAVGVVAVLLLGVIIGWLWSRRRRSASAVIEQQPHVVASPVVAKKGYAYAVPAVPQELDTELPTHELPVKPYHQ